MTRERRGCRDIELFGSLSDNVAMGRPKGCSREEVLEKAMPVFWKHGFADTSVQELERATGVNKSGLYTKTPLGWKTVEPFIKHGPMNKGEQQGCFSVNSMREFAILRDEAYGVV